MLTLHYMDSLISQLRLVGYTHMTLPILALQDVLSCNLLHNDSLRFLVHARATEVCLELNLMQGYAFHQKACGPIALNELDLAKSRDEIAHWREKHSQVAKEEACVHEEMAQLAVRDKQSSRASYVSHRTDQPTDNSSSPIDSHLGKGHLHQTAREFLWEAHDVGVSLSDAPLQALYQRGKLSLDRQAINFCIRAQ
ncbi:CFA46-like protein, partial [Mya arenaria]